MADLRTFLAEMALDSSKFAEFLREPESAMRAAELSEEDRAALVSGIPAMIAARLAAYLSYPPPYYSPSLYVAGTHPVFVTMAHPVYVTSPPGVYVMSPPPLFVTAPPPLYVTPTAPVYVTTSHPVYVTMPPPLVVPKVPPKRK